MLDVGRQGVIDHRLEQAAVGRVRAQDDLAAGIGFDFVRQILQLGVAHPLRPD
jgi:hypothetical protein